MEQRIEVSREVIEALSKRLKAEPGYYAPRLKPEHLEAAVREQRAVFRLCDGRIEAFAALWPTNDPGWLELGTVFVGEALRGKGFRNQLMTEAISLAPENANLLLFSSVGKIMQSATALGFEPITTKNHRVLWWASEVGVVCRLPDSIHPIIPTAGIWGVPTPGERWLFWRIAK